MVPITSIRTGTLTAVPVENSKMQHQQPIDSSGEENMTANGSGRSIASAAEASAYPEVEPESCLRMYRKLAASVSIVSAEGADGPLGLTASSVTSVSLRPPLLLACLAIGSSTLAAIEASGAFAVQLLVEQQQAIARDFASAGGRRFAGREYRYIHEVPVLSGTLAWSVCRLRDSRIYGDHAVVIGEIIAAETGVGRPLLWHSREFAHIADDEHLRPIWLECMYDA